MIGVEVELIGTWLWVTGNTNDYRKELKEIKLRWHSKRQAWYYRKFNYNKTRYSGTSFDNLRAMYGTEDTKQYSETRCKNNSFYGPDLNIVGNRVSLLKQKQNETKRT